MDDVGLAFGGGHPVAMAGALQRIERLVLGGDDVFEGMQLIGPVDLPRAGEGDGVLVAGAALGGQQIVPGLTIMAGALIEMRPFHELQIGAGKDVLDRPDELLRLGIVFLQGDAFEQQRAGPMVP